MKFQVNSGVAEPDNVDLGVAQPDNVDLGVAQPDDTRLLGFRVNRGHVLFKC